MDELQVGGGGDVDVAALPGQEGLAQGLHTLVEQHTQLRHCCAHLQSQPCIMHRAFSRHVLECRCLCAFCSCWLGSTDGARRGLCGCKCLSRSQDANDQEVCRMCIHAYREAQDWLKVYV